MSGKTMGTTLYITVARDRAGNLSEACDEQKFKLFLGAHADLKLSTNDWIISHGKCSFLKAESRHQCPLSIATFLAVLLKSNIFKWSKLCCCDLETSQGENGPNAAGESDRSRCCDVCLLSLFYDLRFEYLFGIICIVLSDIHCLQCAVANRGSKPAEFHLSWNHGNGRCGVGKLHGFGRFSRGPPYYDIICCVSLECCNVKLMLKLIQHLLAIGPEYSSQQGPWDIADAVANSGCLAQEGCVMCH